MAILVRNLTSKLILLTENSADFTKIQLENLKNHSIKIIENHLLEIQHCGGKIRNIIFCDGTKVEAQFLYAILPFQQQSNIAKLLDCSFTKKGLIKVNRQQRTTIRGVYACGDNSSSMRSISKAVYTGSLVGAMLNMEISEESF